MFAVFIASHINYHNQLKLLEKAILSVKNQDYNNENIDIWLSISFSNIEYENNFNEMDISNNCFKCFKQDKQMYQLEHLRYLNEQSYKKYKYEWICFLDDDDEYDKSRITAFKTKANMIKDKNIKRYMLTQIIYEKGKCIIGDSKVLECFIYWLYAIRQDALNVFFKWFSISSLQNNNADFLLKMYFERVFSMNETATIKGGYYLYNTENDNSISKKEDNKGDNICELYYATCMNNKKILIKKYGDKYKEHIDNVLYKECLKHYHNFKYNDEWIKYLIKNIVLYRTSL